MDFNSALSGLKATSSELSVISNNIANVSTNGFKGSRTEFADIYANSSLGGGKTAIGSGVVLSAVTQQFSQGQIGFTDNNLDLAVSGKGFFILSNNGSISYSRAGSFGVDKNGFIVNDSDHHLRGFLADSSGSITGAQTDLQINSATLAPKPTGTVSVNVNLDATAEPPTAPFITGFTPTQPPDPTTYNSSTSTTVYDSLGNSHIMTTYFVKAHAENTWRAFVGIDGSDVTPIPNTPPVGVPPVQYPAGQIASPYTLVFNQSGSYVTNNPATPATYYGPGPVNSTTSGLLTAGTLPTLNLNDLTINSVAITASGSSSDGSSTTDNSASSIAIAAAINQSTAAHGVTATVNPNVVDLGIPTFGNLAAGDFSINNVPITGVNADASDLLGLINAQTATTGVTGTQPGGVGTSIILTSTDSRNIQLTTDGIQATGASFANFDLNSGVALNQAQRGTISLSATNNQGIIIGGPNPGHASLTAGPQAGIVQSSSDVIDIANWTPTGGAFGPQLMSMNFNNSTQYGAPFSVLALSQNGYSTGLLAGVNVDSSGVIFAKYNNGQSLALGQVALANFGNMQGLNPQGNTSWVETFSSGSALIGAPGTAELGTIQSGALENSNVELTDELVELIVAQRNFQANAQSIKTADAVTQTIINLR